MTDRALSLPSALPTLESSMIAPCGDLSAGCDCLANALSRYRQDVAGGVGNVQIRKL